MEKRKTLRCFFPQLLGKAEHQTLGFSTVPTGPATVNTKTENKKSEGSGSTLADLVFCPNNGVHLRGILQVRSENAIYRLIDGLNSGFSGFIWRIFFWNLDRSYRS